MNDPSAAIALGRRIDLTREPDVVIGVVVIQPTACEVTAHGRRVRLQRRVMEVLVALSRAGGQPVSRETLLSVCWGDVTIGEDALNRCIQRLRRLSEAEANGAFAIETIPRMGYRLAVAGGGIVSDEVDAVVDRAEVAAAAERALQLDPGCGLAHAALSALLPWGDYEGREAALQRALAVGPRDPQTAIEMGWFLVNVGRNEEALRYAAQGLELDPLNGAAANIYSQLLALVGRYEDSLRAYAVYREKWPLSPVFTIAPLSHAYLQGDRTTYDSLRRAAVDLGLTGKFVTQALAAGEMRFDPTPKSRERILDGIGERIRKTGTVVLGRLILAYAMGLRDEVFGFIDQASFAHLFDKDGPPPASHYSPGVIFDRTANLGMMQDLRFVGFCAKLGLCDYWVNTGRWPDCAEAGVLLYDFKAECRRLAAIG